MMNKLVAIISLLSLTATIDVLAAKAKAVDIPLFFNKRLKNGIQEVVDKRINADITNNLTPQFYIFNGVDEPLSVRAKAGGQDIVVDTIKPHEDLKVNIPQITVKQLESAGSALNIKIVGGNSNFIYKERSFKADEIKKLSTFDEQNKQGMIFLFFVKEKRVKANLYRIIYKNVNDKWQWRLKEFFDYIVHV